MMQHFHCQRMLPEAWGTRWQLRQGPRCQVQAAAWGVVRLEGDHPRRHALQSVDAADAAVKLRGRQQHSVTTQGNGFTGSRRAVRASWHLQCMRLRGQWQDCPICLPVLARPCSTAS